MVALLLVEANDILITHCEIPTRKRTDKLGLKVAAVNKPNAAACGLTGHIVGGGLTLCGIQRHASPLLNLLEG